MSSCGHVPHDVEYTKQTEELLVNQGFPHNSEDPTATKELRKRYMGEMYRRFRALKGAIREAVVARDVFGLKGDNPRGRRSRTRIQANRGGDINIQPPTAGAYAFPSDERKVEEFMSWLDEQVDRGILEAGAHARREAGAAAGAWQNTYIRSAYEKGVTHADDALFRMDIAESGELAEDIFRSAKHADAAGLAYVRAYRELEGVTADMERQISRELANGLTQGENPRKIASRLNDRVDKVGLSRGRMIARTETIRAHNEGALNRYEDFRERIEGVGVVVEHMTAGDARVCTICQGLAGRRYDIEEARGRIPVHPNCRCTFVPVRQSDPRGTVAG